MEKPSVPFQEMTPSSPSRNTEEMVKEIDFILDQHESLRDKWEDLVKDLPLEQQFLRLRELARKRREMIAPKSYLSENLSLLDTFPEQAETLLHEIEHSLENKKTSREVDRGFNGKIMEFVIPGEAEPNVVFKMLIRSPIGEQNDLLSEASYLADLHELAKKNPDLLVGVPQVFYCATASNARIIAMQKVPGISIENIISEKKSIPEDFDIDMVAQELLEFTHRINDAGFHHNDLREGNIMIDFSALPGQPLAYVIDTGSAKRVYWRSEEEHKFDRSPDPGMLTRAIESLRNYKTRQRREVSL